MKVAVSLACPHFHIISSFTRFSPFKASNQLLITPKVAFLSSITAKLSFIPLKSDKRKTTMQLHVLESNKNYIVMVLTWIVILSKELYIKIPEQVRKISSNTTYKFKPSLQQWFLTYVRPLGVSDMLHFSSFYREINICIQLYGYLRSIKMDLQEVGGSCRDWMELAHDRERWWALVSIVMNFQVP
jgi:hypothetical protein